jgi:DNA-binding protein HU-beta
MNKAELVSAIANRSKISKVAAESCLDNTLAIIQKAVSQGEDVKLVGFGTFCRAERKPKTGRNPKTGQTYKIPTTTVPRFKPGKEFKDVVK